jgi:hypothetical protein
LASIVLLKISDVSRNRKTTKKVRKRFVPMTAGSMPPGSGASSDPTIAGT